MMMMNCSCGTVDWRKAFSLISRQGHCQRSSPSRITDTPRAGFEPAPNLCSDFVEWSCAVVITITPRRMQCVIITIAVFVCNFRMQCVIITLADGREKMELSLTTFFKFRKVIEFESSSIVVCFSYIYLTIDGKRSFIN